MDTFLLAKSIVSRLVKKGYTAYFAGGWVRDFIMGHPSDDIDIATNAAPVEIMNLFPNTILVGLSFGVVIVVLEGHQFEVATFRKDLQYVDGRHPLGIEMSNPREDALRRDFTINGMFYDPLEEEIHDFVQGREDIKRGIIRSIGDANERFFEDRLRMLRAFRFSSRLNFTIDPDTQEAIRENADKLFPSVAMERVWQEFNKMAAYPGFDRAILDMHRSGILEIIFPELKDIHLHDLRDRIVVIAHLPHDSPTIVYLMELFTGQSAEKKVDIAKRLKATNKDIKLVEFLDDLFRAIQSDHVDLPKWTYLLANPDSQLGLDVFASRLAEGEKVEFNRQISERKKRLESHIKRVQDGQPLVSALFLQQKGIRPGKQMGLLLKEAEKIAINDDLSDAGQVLDKLSGLPIWKELQT